MPGKLRILALLCALPLLPACETDPGDESADSTEDSGDTSDTEDTGEDTGEDTMGPEDGEGPENSEAFAALCAEQATESDCNAIEGEHYPWEDYTAWCSWFVEVPVSYADGVCEFGEATSYCMMEGASEAGCGGGGDQCGVPKVGMVNVEGDETVLVLGGSCETSQCQVNEQGEVTHGPPECACFCDPAFPS